MKRRGEKIFFFPFCSESRRRSKTKNINYFSSQSQGKKLEGKTAQTQATIPDYSGSATWTLKNPDPTHTPLRPPGKRPTPAQGSACLQTAAENSHSLHKGSSGQSTDGYKAQRHISIESAGYSGLEWYWIMLDRNYLISGKVIRTLNSKLNFYWSVHVFCLHKLPLCCCQLTHAS